MIDFDTCLAGYTDRVLLARDITPAYAAKVRYCIAGFCKWLGCDPGIDGLAPEPVNEFLMHLAESGKRPDTIAGYRRAILVVWNEAYRSGDNNQPPLRVRRIKTPRDPVEAFTHNAIRTLLEYVGQLPGYFPNGVKRSAFWTAAIHAAYSTGLRRSDLLRVKRSQINENGVARIRQSKTGHTIAVWFSMSARQAIAEMEVEERALPWPFHPNALSRQFRKLAMAAGVGGQFRWLRRACGSYAERENSGSGTRALGHRSERIFRDYYEDQSITDRQPVVPPEL